MITYARQIEYKKDLRINRREWWHNRFFCKSIRNIFQSSFVLIFVQIKGISPLSPWLKKNQLIVFVGKRFDVRLSLLKKFGKHSNVITMTQVWKLLPKLAQYYSLVLTFQIQKWLLEIDPYRVQLQKIRVSQMYWPCDLFVQNLQMFYYMLH